MGNLACDGLTAYRASSCLVLTPQLAGWEEEARALQGQVADYEKHIEVRDVWKRSHGPHSA